MGEVPLYPGRATGVPRLYEIAAPKGPTQAPRHTPAVGSLGERFLMSEVPL